MLGVKRLQQRAAFFQAIRSFFQLQGFLEVDTPIRQPLLIPEHTIIPFPSGSHFLQSSPELYMKRLLAGGSERIFQICHCFRSEERGRLHLEEFVMLEWYRLDTDYEALMADCQQLLAHIALAMDGSLLSLSLDGEWERLTVEEAFNTYCSVSAADALETEMFDQLLVEQIEPHLGQERPTFLCDYPLQLASLARQKKGQPEVAERFELYISGVEIANGFSELTDPDIQRRRFLQEYELMEGGEVGRNSMPERFLRDLEKIDRAAGIAMGLDRLLMLFLGESRVGDVISFTSEELDC